MKKILTTAALVATTATLPAIPAVAADDTSIWDKVAACESSNDWDINTGNGFYGGLQFTESTWNEFGGQEFADRADHATKAEQITVAQRVLEGQGPGAWPVCSIEAGLTKENGGATEYAPKRVDSDTDTSNSDSDTYTVQPGDTLTSISRLYGYGENWHTLYDLNVDAIADPDLIYPGQHFVTDAPRRAVAEATPVLVKPINAEPGSRRFGVYLHPILNVWKMHNGVDFGAETGTAIRAAGTGKVTTAGWSDGYGNYVIIDHGDGLQTLYGHMSKMLVAKGQTVAQGDVIGRVGETGLATGPHLHFEVREDGVAVDPMPFIE